MKLTETQIADELRAMRPQPAAEFAAALDESASLPRTARASLGDSARRLAALPRRLASAPPLRRRPALAAFAALAIIGVSALGVSLVSQGKDTNTSDRGGAELLSKPSSGAAAVPGAANDTVQGTTAAPAPPGDLAAGAKARQVERTASLTLSTEAGKLADVADGVVEVTDRYGGFVVSSNVHTSGDQGSRAAFELRVPTPRLQQALADLSGLAHVKSRNEGSLDITAPFVSASQRVKDFKAEVDGLLAQLASAATPEQSAALRARLRSVRAELASARAELQSISQRAELTTISVTVLGDGDAGGGGWGIDDAAGDAVSVLRTIAAAALVSLAVLVPLALLGSLLWFGGRAARRRAREQALD